MRQIRQFIHTEALSGIILLVAAVFALVLDNSSGQQFYQGLVHSKFQIPLEAIVNHGLMTLFFLLVGLEIKREIIKGELNSYQKIILPAIAALGGMLVPAVLYFFINWHNAVALRGWAIPCATDIAFALAVLQILHRFVPTSLKVFLTTLAILDDIGAIVIIAIFYSMQITWFYLGLSLLCILLLILLNYFQIKKLTPYLILGVILWFFILRSGIDAVMAGVIVALTIPMTSNASYSPLEYLEKKLHPWVAFLILPLFAFINAGVSLQDIQGNILFNSVAWGIILGLFLGKQFGVLMSSWIAIKLRWATMPVNANWRDIYGVAIICGIGFTMSLFIGTLAFKGINSDYAAAVRFGVLGGSLISGMMGYCILRFRKM